ncbi:MAG: hypothetical protein AAF586_02435 [Planctomycetota bacterium]
MRLSSQAIFFVSLSAALLTGSVLYLTGDGTATLADGTVKGVGREVDAILSIAFSLIVFAITLSALIVLRSILVRSASTSVGCCVRCGYDLRGIVSACPECGVLVQRNGQNR